MVITRSVLLEFEHLYVKFANDSIVFGQEDNHATELSVVGNTTTGAVSSTIGAGPQSQAHGLGYAAQLIAYPTQDLGLTLGYWHSYRQKLRQLCRHYQFSGFNRLVLREPHL